MITNIDHINIVVHDLDRMVAFYTEVLGLTATKRAHLEGDWIEAIVGLQGVSADVVFVEPTGGGPRIELIKYHTPEGVDFPAHSAPNTFGLRHIALRTNDITGAHTRLIEAGVKIFGPPVLVPNGVVRHDAGNKQLLYFHDPEGVLLELTQYTEEFTTDAHR